jgi:hypothetical protein
MRRRPFDSTHVDRLIGVIEEPDDDEARSQPMRLSSIPRMPPTTLRRKRPLRPKPRG